MGEGKTFSRRLAGFSKSETVDAKFFLLAVAPALPLMLADHLGWARGFLWHAWFWFSVVWGVGVLAISIAVYWQMFRRFLRRKP